MTGEIINYVSLLYDIKERIRQAQTQAILSANREMLILYWNVGRIIQSRQDVEGWGAGVIPRLSRDLRNDLPEIKGFSERNLKRMVRFYREYPALIPIETQNMPQSIDSGREKKYHSLWHFYMLFHPLARKLYPRPYWNSLGVTTSY